jgi:hypothetical protein
MSPASAWHKNSSAAYIAMAGNKVQAADRSGGAAIHNNHNEAADESSAFIAAMRRVST